MRNRLGRGATVAVALVLVVAACGDDSVLGPDGTGSTTEASEDTSQTTAPPDTTEAPPQTTATTSTTTTTESAEVQCVSSGGVFAPEEGPDGICFPGGEITAEEYRVWHVDLDDPDGGLLVWTGPGAPDSNVPQDDKYVQVGVIPPFEDGVTVTGHATPDGLWYYVEYDGFAGWARSYYLVAMDGAPGLPVCLEGSVGPIPDTAQSVTTLTGNLDGKQGDDTFSIYWNGSDWMAHMRTAYGYHAEMPSGHAGVAPGTGPEVFAGQLWDFLGDGRDEAWVMDNTPASGEIWSLFAWFNDGCRLEHVTHNSTGNPHYWVVGGGVTYIDSMSCDTDGIIHYDGNAVGINDFEGEASLHWYDFEDGVAAEWWAIGGSWFATADGDPMPYGFECPFP